MGKSLNMNYVNCALLVVVLVLVVVCCAKSKTKEGFKMIQVTENGRTYPNAVSCSRGKVCNRVRARQYNWLRAKAAECDKKRECVQEYELNNIGGLIGYVMGANAAYDEHVYGNFCPCPEHGQDAKKSVWGVPDVT
jgi:hypothetical protein